MSFFKRSKLTAAKSLTFSSLFRAPGFGDADFPLELEVESEDAFVGSVTIVQDDDRRPSVRARSRLGPTGVLIETSQ